MNRAVGGFAARAIAATLLAASTVVVPLYAQAPPAAVAAAPGAASIDIRDIRGPEPIPSPWLWALWCAGGAVVAAGSYAAWRWHRRRSLAPAKLPFETALERLDAARALMVPNAAREFSISVSDIIRVYVEECFHVMAAHRTTEEFLHDLLHPADDRLSTHRSSLAGFLNHCDLAKFGGWALSTADMEAMHESARAFVLATAEPAATPLTPSVSASVLSEEMYGSLPST